MTYDIQIKNENGADQLVSDAAYSTILYKATITVGDNGTFIKPVTITGTEWLLPGHGVYVRPVSGVQGGTYVPTQFYRSRVYCSNGSTICEMPYPGTWEILLVRPSTQADMAGKTSGYGIVLYNGYGTPVYSSQIDGFVITSTVEITLNYNTPNASGSFVVSSSPYPQEPLFFNCSHDLLNPFGTLTGVILVYVWSGSGNTWRQLEFSATQNNNVFTWTTKFRQDITLSGGAAVPFPTYTPIVFNFGLVK